MGFRQPAALLQQHHRAPASLTGGDREPDRAALANANHLLGDEQVVQ